MYRCADPGRFTCFHGEQDHNVKVECGVNGFPLVNMQEKQLIWFILTAIFWMEEIYVVLWYLVRIVEYGSHFIEVVLRETILVTNKKSVHMMNTPSKLYKGHDDTTYWRYK